MSSRELESLIRIEAVLESQGRELGEVKRAIISMDARLDSTRDIAVAARAGAKRSGALTGTVASGGLLGVVEFVRTFFPS